MEETAWSSASCDESQQAASNTAIESFWRCIFVRISAFLRSICVSGGFRRVLGESQGRAWGVRGVPGGPRGVPEASGTSLGGPRACPVVPGASPGPRGRPRGFQGRARGIPGIPGGSRDVLGIPGILVMKMIP